MFGRNGQFFLMWHQSCSFFGSNVDFFFCYFRVFPCLVSVCSAFLKLIENLSLCGRNTRCFRSLCFFKVPFLLCFSIAQCFLKTALRRAESDLRSPVTFYSKVSLILWWSPDPSFNTLLYLELVGRLKINWTKALCSSTPHGALSGCGMKLGRRESPFPERPGKRMVFKDSDRPSNREISISYTLVNAQSSTVLYVLRVSRLYICLARGCSKGSFSILLVQLIWYGRGRALFQASAVSPQRPIILPGTKNASAAF